MKVIFVLFFSKYIPVVKVEHDFIKAVSVLVLIITMVVKSKAIYNISDFMVRRLVVCFH